MSSPAYRTVCDGCGEFFLVEALSWFDDGQAFCEPCAEAMLEEATREFSKPELRPAFPVYVFSDGEGRVLSVSCDPNAGFRADVSGVITRHTAAFGASASVAEKIRASLCKKLAPLFNNNLNQDLKVDAEIVENFEDEPFDINVAVRISPSSSLNITEIAAFYGIRRSEWVRNVLYRAIFEEKRTIEHIKKEKEIKFVSLQNEQNDTE